MKHKKSKYKLQSKKVASRSVRRPIDPTFEEQEELVSIEEDLHRSSSEDLEAYYPIFESELEEMELHAPSEFLPQADEE